MSQYYGHKKPITFGRVLLHIILTLITGGLWLIVLLIMALLNHSGR